MWYSYGPNWSALGRFIDLDTACHIFSTYVWPLILLYIGAKSKQIGVASRTLIGFIRSQKVIIAVLLPLSLFLVLGVQYALEPRPLVIEHYNVLAGTSTSFSYASSGLDFFVFVVGYIVLIAGLFGGLALAGRKTTEHALTTS